MARVKPVLNDYTLASDLDRQFGDLPVGLRKMRQTQPGPRLAYYGRPRFFVLKGGRNFHALSRIALIFFCPARHECRPLCTLHDKLGPGGPNELRHRSPMERYLLG